MIVSNTLYPRPSFKDWALLAVNIVFVVGGAILLPSNRDVGIVTIAFCGPCGAIALIIIVRKLRFHRLRALKAEIVGGVPIRPSRATLAISGATLATMGVILILFGRPYGIIFWGIAWLIVLIGGAILIGVTVRLIPSDYIQFDPEGITFGRSRYAYTVSWEAIARVSAGQVHNNPALFIWLHDDAVIDVHPAEYRQRIRKQFATNVRWTGVPILLLPSLYGLDLPLLMLALERYLTEPATRSELARRLLPQAGPSAQT